MADRSPLPWRQGSGVEKTSVLDTTGEELLSLYVNDGCDEPTAIPWEANLAFIVKAVNHHDELVAALQAHDDYMLRDLGYANPLDKALHPKAATNWARIRAVLAKVKDGQ